MVENELTEPTTTSTSIEQTENKSSTPTSDEISLLDDKPQSIKCEHLFLLIIFLVLLTLFISSKTIYDLEVYYNLEQVNGPLSSPQHK
jgi:hypothetical protein